MKRETLLTISVIVLLLLNIATLGFVYWSRMAPGHGDAGNPKPTTYWVYDAGDMTPMDKTIVETLHLDSTKRTEFETLKKEHHSKMKVLDSAYTTQLKSYFDLLRLKDVAKAAHDSAESILARTQALRAAVTFDHFQKLKELCITPSQLAQFDSLLPALERRLMGIHIEYAPPGVDHPMPLWVRTANWATCRRRRHPRHPNHRRRHIRRRPNEANA